MKRSSFLKNILLLCCSIFTASAALAENIVKLHGKITNPATDSVNVQFYINDVEVQAKNYAAHLSSDGKFSLQFPVADEFTSIMFVHGDQMTELVVKPGYDLDMTLDAKNFDSSLHYTGKGAAEANFCALHELIYGSQLLFERNAQLLCTKGPADFERSLDSVYKVEMAFVEEHKKGLDPVFIKFWSASYRYGTYSVMLIYPQFHEMNKQHTMYIKDIPQEDYVVLKDVPEAFDDNLLGLSAYQVYLDRFYQAGLNQAGIKEKPFDSLTHFALGHNNMPPKTADFYAATVINRNFKFSSLAAGEQGVAGYKKRFPHGHYTTMLEKNLATKRKLSPGSPAVDFAFHTLDGKDIHLSDLKGKVVMLDFWASWCMPCMAEMPKAAELEKAYKDKDIIFLYVSVDEDEGNWKKAIEKHNIEGMHTRVAGAMEGPVAKEYAIQSIPSYYLIDKNGNYADMQMLRPHDGDKLKAIIDSLLK